MPRRTVADYGFDTLRITLTMREADWRNLKRAGDLKQMEMGPLIEVILREWLEPWSKEEITRAVGVALKPEGSHEEADVR
jgi:hypothetical protein